MKMNDELGGLKVHALDEMVVPGNIYAAVHPNEDYYMFFKTRQPDATNKLRMGDDLKLFGPDTTFLILEPPTEIDLDTSASSDWKAEGLDRIHTLDPFYSIKVLFTNEDIHSTDRANKSMQVGFVAANKFIFFSNLKKIDE